MMEPLEPAPQPKSRGRLALGIVAGLVVVGLIVAAVLIIPRLQQPAASTVNISASAMPADTQVYFAFNPHYDKLPNGGVVRKAWSDPDVFQPLEDDIREGLAGRDLDWDKDIAPWLGDEVAIGVSNLPLGPSDPDAPPPRAVLAAATRDVAASNQMLSRLRSQAESSGAEFREQAYRGVTIVEQVDVRPDSAIAYATINDMLIAATGADSLRAAIDALLDGKGLDKSSDYRAAVGPLRGGRALTAYADVGALFKPMLDQLSREMPSGLMLSGLDQTRFGLGLSFEPNGALLEVITLGDPAIGLPVEDKTGAQAVPNPNRLLRAVPDSTFLYMSGRRLADWYDDMLAILKAAGPQVGVEDALGDLERQTGIDLQEDIFGWMTGEAAVAVMPSGGLLGGPAPLPFGFALIIEAGDKERAASGPHKLLQLLAAQSRASIEDVTVGDYPMHAYVDPASGSSTFVYGLMGDNFVLALPESAARRIATAGSRPLADDADFKAAIAPLPRDTIGYVYFKPESIVSLATAGLRLNDQECPACVLLDPVRALAFTIEYPPKQAGSVRSVMFLMLDVE